MKKKITALLVILAIMAAVPLIFNVNSLSESLKSRENMSKNEIITSAAAYHFRKHYSKNTLKAIIIILNTNYKANKLNKKEFLSKEEFIKKYKKGESYYSEIENLAKENGDNYITYKGKPVHIPYFKLSKGFTEKDKKYPYLKGCACPWDKFKKDFKNSENTVGISINSLNKLCRKGLSCENALKHFLNPKSSIINNNTE